MAWETRTRVIKVRLSEREMETVKKHCPPGEPISIWLRRIALEGPERALQIPSNSAAVPETPNITTATEGPTNAVEKHALTVSSPIGGPYESPMVSAQAAELLGKHRALENGSDSTEKPGTEVALTSSTTYNDLSFSSPSKPKSQDSTRSPKRARAREDDPMGFGSTTNGLDKLVGLWAELEPFSLLPPEKRRSRAKLILKRWPGVDHHAITLGAAVWWEDCEGKMIKGKRKGNPVKNIASWIYNQWPNEIEHEAKRQNRILIDAERARKNNKPSPDEEKRQEAEELQQDIEATDRFTRERHGE